MTQAAQPKRRWLRWLKWLAIAAVLLAIAVTAAVQSGLAENWMHGVIVSQIARITGGQVELRAFRFRFTDLRAELEGLTIRGREPEGTPPLFHAGRIVVDLRVISFFGRKVALDQLMIDQPAVHLHFDEEGRSNYPGPQTPPRQPGKPLREQIFGVTIGELRLNEGTVQFNQTRIPLVVQGGDFNFALDYHAPAEGEPFYTGDFAWKQMRLVARRYLPFAADVTARFRLTRGSFTLDEVRWKLPRSEFRVSAALASFAEPDWTFRYQGWLSLDDLQQIMRKPNAPDGLVEFQGEGSARQKKVLVTGRYVARNVGLPYEWFHAKGLESRGSYRIEDGRVTVPDFRLKVLGGEMQGRVTLDIAEQKWRAETRSRGLDLAGVLHAVNHPGFPVDAFHWGGTASLDDVTTWRADFKSVESRGVMRWEPAAEPRAEEIPATAHFDYHYVMDRKRLELRAGEIATPSSRVAVTGLLGAHDSALDAEVEIQDLLPWNDFIHALRGEDSEPVRIAGRAHWKGRVLGDLGKPTFEGHVRGAQVAYGRLFWDEVEGDMTYSPDEFVFRRARARRDDSSAGLDVRLDLTDWRFLPESEWSFDARLERADTDELQSLFGTSYAARGLLTGEFHGRGTRSDPKLTGVFDLSAVQAYGIALERVRGNLAVRRDEVRISDAELVMNGGRAAGNLLYRPVAEEIQFQLAATDVPIERLARLEKTRLPIAGRLSFDWKGEGPLTAPRSTGTFRIADFAAGGELQGTLEGTLRSDGRRVNLELRSAMTEGSVQGRLDLTLGGDYPLSGEITLAGVDIDSFIKSAFRIRELTGHSRVDGRFQLSGALRHPETITVDADISSLRMNYQGVQLENDGPLRLAYSRLEVRIQQAHLRGTDTDFTVGGSARFTGNRALDLRLAGTVNLQLFSAFFPDLNARGAAQVNATVEGSFDKPRINGRVTVEDASATYGDFPAGLSHITGALVFDSSRLLFDDIVAEAGGGRMRLSGSLTYGDGPVRYDLNARADRVRVRYPEGMSWLAGGQIRLSGTTRAGVLSGRVVVDRVLFSEGFDFATLAGGGRGGLRAPTTTSLYLRNLQFDIEATSSPDARLEWSGARFETEANIRVRGTWENPILLGNIRMLSGDIQFRGNRYRLTRGDLIFSKPFRIDPELNIEAVTTIRQYEITLNLTGPASKLALSYRSDPPLPSSDIIGLLALGRTGEESELRGGPTPVQSPELGATTLLSEAISSQIGGRVERLFGISRFKVDPFLAGTGNEQNASARLTIEQQVTRDLTITYITNVTSTQQQVIQVEYNVKPDVSLVFLRDQNGTFSLGLKFKKRFK